jgi:hypothetical protein
MSSEFVGKDTGKEIRELKEEVLNLRSKVERLTRKIKEKDPLWQDSDGSEDDEPILSKDPLEIKRLVILSQYHQTLNKETILVTEPLLYKGKAMHPRYSSLNFHKMTRYGPKSYVSARLPPGPSGSIIGYTRCSGPNDSQYNQVELFIEEYAKKNEDKPLAYIGHDYSISGNNGFSVQKALNALLWNIKPGDILVTSYCDRLTHDRGVADQILEYLKSKGAVYTPVHFL